MLNKADKANRKRLTSEVTIRLDEEEKEQWREKAILAGLPISRMVRQSVKEISFVPAEDSDSREKLRQEIKRIGNNLNQLARWGEYLQG